MKHVEQLDFELGELGYWQETQCWGECKLPDVITLQSLRGILSYPSLRGRCHSHVPQWCQRLRAVESIRHLPHEFHAFQEVSRYIAVDKPWFHCHLDEFPIPKNNESFPNSFTSNSFHELLLKWSIIGEELLTKDISSSMTTKMINSFPWSL